MRVSENQAQSSPDVRFVVIGDRTGTHQAGVFEQVWKEAAAWQPAFAVTIGDWIEGGNDATAEREWRELQPILRDARIPTYFVAGNHDIWNRPSRQLFERFTGRPARYAFSHGNARFVILDNANSLELPGEELDFLEKDLAAHRGARVKFVFFHRPDWIFKVMLGQRDFRLHQIAKRHNVTAVFSGHTHMYKRIVFEGINYMMVASAGGSIRSRDPRTSGFAEGFFYGYTQVTVRGGAVEIVTQELGEPFGRGRRVYAEER